MILIVYDTSINDTKKEVNRIMRIFAYCRVSTTEQTTENQVIAIRQKGYEVLQVASHFLNSFTLNVIVGEDPNVAEDFSKNIRALCDQYDIRYIERNDLHSYSSKADIAFAIGWRWLIKDADNLIVFHDSILPRYRGFNPLVTALINGDDELGVTAIFATEDFDKGDIIDCETFTVTYPCTIENAIELMSRSYGALFGRIAKNILNSEELNRRPQKEEQATYSIWRDDKDYFIDWTQPTEKVLRFIDANNL